MKQTIRIKAALLLAAGCSLLASAGWAAQLGDPAAPLAIKEWIKGNPVNVKDGKNIYVVEFWATWCPPCRRSIPHLTEIQKKFKDKGVVVVGISDEAPATVKPFVQKMAGEMDTRWPSTTDARATEATCWPMARMASLTPSLWARTARWSGKVILWTVWTKRWPDWWRRATRSSP